MSDETIIYSNQAFDRIFKHGGNPAVLLTYIDPEDRQYVIDNYSACKSGDKIDDFECRIVIDRERRCYKISAVLLEFPSGQHIIGCSAEDITDLKNYLNILNEHNKKKNSILNIVSHDLMGPIGIIKSLSGLLSDPEKVRDERRLQQYLTLINRSSKKCIDLIRNFINKEFMESFSVNLVKKRIELVEKMRVLIDEYVSSQADLRKQFKLYNNREIIYAEIDEDKFFQILNNLISNSLKFTDDGGTISVSIEDQDTSILIAVADDGIGIPEEFQDNLFDEFNSARRVGLKGEESIGLGMSIIKTIVEWHDGKIWFDSKENVGTTFYIQIPK